MSLDLIKHTIKCNFSFKKKYKKIKPVKITIILYNYIFRRNNTYNKKPFALKLGGSS